MLGLNLWVRDLAVIDANRKIDALAVAQTEEL